MSTSSVRSSSGGIRPKRYDPVDWPRPGTLVNGRSVRVAPPSTFAASRTTTSSPARASRIAETRPLWPAPMMTTSACAGRGVMTSERSASIWRPASAFRMRKVALCCSGPAVGDRRRVAGQNQDVEQVEPEADRDHAADLVEAAEGRTEVERQRAEQDESVQESGQVGGREGADQGGGQPGRAV